MSGVLTYADERGRDGFAFQPIESRYLEVADDLRIRTPYSRAVVDELRLVPWAWWDGDLEAWRVPFRSWEDLRRRWPTIEAAAHNLILVGGTGHQEDSPGDGFGRCR
jgi:hypothetical protein